MNSTSIEVSSPVPTTSPSPCRACPSPMKSSAPGSFTGSITFTPAVSAGVVHVAAERAGRGGGNRLLARRRHADAAEHRPQRQRRSAGRMSDSASVAVPAALSICQFTRRGSRSCRVAIGRGIGRIRRQQAARIRRRAVGLDLLDASRPGCRRARPPRRRTARSADSVPCARGLPSQSTPRGVDGPGDDAVAGLDPQRRRMRERERVVEALGNEAVGIGLEDRRARLGRHQGGKRVANPRPPGVHGDCRDPESYIGASAAMRRWLRLAEAAVQLGRRRPAGQRAEGAAARRSPVPRP